MAHSLETRVPFLDDDLVEFAVRVPARYKLRNLEQHGPRSTRTCPASGSCYEVETSDGKAVLRKAMTPLHPAGDHGAHQAGLQRSGRQLVPRREHRLHQPAAAQPAGPHLRVHQPGLRRRRCSTSTAPARSNRRLLIWSFLSLEWWLASYFAGQTATTPQRLSAYAPSPRASHVEPWGLLALTTPRARVARPGA